MNDSYPIDLDHNATTPLLPEVVDAMVPFLRTGSGNSSSGHLGSSLGEWGRTGVVGPDAKYEVEGIGSSKPPDNLDRSAIDDVEHVR